VLARAAGLVSAYGASWLAGPAWSAAGPASAALPRRALVIGNNAYLGAALKNAVNDARLMASTLGELGFGVDLLEDASRDRMLQAAASFFASTVDAEVRVLYFAGHGAQYRGRNFLMPVDAQLGSEDDLPARAVNAQDLADRFSRFTQGVNLLIFDACRSAPVRAAGGPKTRAIGADSQGLAPTLAPRGTLIAYATSPDRVALDNPNASNGVYTRHLARQLRTPGTPVEQVFKRVRLAVMHDTGNRQVPWESSSLVGELVLMDGPRGLSARSSKRPA
jgi:uncharacterized caspase-like protein